MGRRGAREGIRCRHRTRGGRGGMAVPGRPVGGGGGSSHRAASDRFDRRMDRFSDGEMMIDASPKRETTRRPIFFESREGTLFGVFTSPSEPTRVANKAVVLLQGGGIPSSGVNRDAVRLADRLASMGYASFRFDFHGMGDSSGVCQRVRLDEPFVDDLEAALLWLRGEQGISHFALVGNC